MSRYDIEKFDPPPDPDLVCCICQCVLDQAVECPCRHVFCQSCIERWLTNRHTCPTCRKRTMKPDLKPVLPLVQNMLNRLFMICDYRDNGCLDKIMLENYENHVKDCGFEMKKCRFIKCGEDILKMNLERHEGVECEHRESLCGGECGLMIALSDRPTHDCMDALKAHIDEKNRMIETLKSKLHELNNLSQSLNDQLEQLRQQLDENRPRSSLGSFSGSDTDVTEFMSDQESFFDDSSDSFDQHLSDNNTNNNIAAADNINNDNVDATTAVTDNEPVNDVMEQFEVTVVNSLFDLSSRLERVRDEMRTVLNTGTPADNNNLTENLGMRSARIDDIIDNMSRSINDTSVHSDRTGGQGTISSNGLESNRIVSQVNATVEHGDTSPGHDELNNNVTDSQNDSDREPHSDHSYSAASSWRSPEHHTYSDRSPHSSDRSRSHSYTPPHDLDNLSHMSYSSTSDRNSDPLGTPNSYRRYSDRNSGSLSPISGRYSEHRSNVSDASSRSQTPTPRYSRYDPEDSPRTGSAHRSLSPSSDRSNRSYNRSWSNSSLTPRNSSGHRSDGSLSPRSPASGNWSSDNWNSDDGASERSRHSEDNWSHKSRSTLSHRGGVSDDEKSNTDASHMSTDHHVKDSDKESEISDWCTGGTRTPVSEERNSNSGGSHMSDDHHRKDSDRESAVSDWCTGGTRTPAGSPRHSDSDCEMASRTPTSDRDFKGQSSDHMTSPSQSEADSDCGSRTPQGGTSSEESLPTPVKIREHSDMSDSSPASHRSPPWRDTDESDVDSAVSENNSPYSERKKSCTRRSRLKNKGQRSPAMETIKTDPHEVDLGRNKDKFKSKTSGDKRDVYSSRRHSPASVGVNSGRVEGKGCRPNVRNDKDETQMSASDSGVFSASNSSEINPETISRNTDRKRKAEKESALSTRSKRNRSAAVSLNSHQIIPGSSTTIQTSVPQSGTSPSNVNVKIDLSLYNISGQLIPQTNTVSSGGSISNSGCSVIRQAASSHSSSTSPMKTVDNTKNVLQRQRMTRSIHTRSTTVASGKLEGPNSKSASQNKDTTEKHVKKQTGSDRQRSSIPSFANRDFPNSWCDDSDSESDQTWLPGSDKSETDDSLTEDEEILSDSSYEVVIPKTAKDLLEEYKSDDTDESWTPS